MKIGVVSNLYPPYVRGGAEHIAWRVAHELHVRGHDVFVVTTKPYENLSSFHAKMKEKHIEKIYRFYPMNLYHQLKDGGIPFPIRIIWHLLDTYSLHPAREVQKVFRQEEPDIVLTHNIKGLGLQAMKAIRSYGAPNIHTVHDVQLTVPSGLMIHGNEEGGLNNPILRKWYERIIRTIMKSPEVVISPSAFLAGLYRDRGFFPQSRIEVIPNPVPTVPRKNRSSRKKEGRLVLLFAGQIEEHKGIRFLLETLNDAGIDFELHIAGEGALSDYVNDWHRRDKRIVYHGFISMNALNNLLAISDLVLVPSLCYENSPTVIYEAFGAGVPVLASDIGGIGELVKEGENGYLFIPGDKKMFLSKLRTFIAKREEFWKKADDIREGIEPNTISHYVDRLEQLMDELKENKK